MEWEDYRVFLAVRRRGGFAAAAPDLGMVAATVRRRIERLEASLGETLFEAAGSRLTPTAAGLALMDLAEAMEQAAEAFAEAAVDERVGLAGPVAVAAAETLGEAVMVPLAARLRRSHPAIRIDLILAAEPSRDLIDQADAALLTAPPEAGGFAIERVATVEYGLFARRDLLDALGRPADVAGLRGLPLVGRRFDRQARTAFPIHGLDAADAAFRLRADGGAAQLAAVRAGGGVGQCMVPLAGLQPDLERVLPGLAWRSGVWLASHAGEDEVARVRLVLAGIRRQVGLFAGAALAKAV